VQPSDLTVRITKSAIPPYEQLRAQVSLSVASGRVRPEAKLPTIRALAAHLGLATNTVARAYRELEAQQIVVTRGRAGTFVSAEPPVSFKVIERAERLEAAARQFALEAAQLAISDTEAVTAVTAALRDLATAEESAEPNP